jgi:Flp pilus assembly protein TadD
MLRRRIFRAWLLAVLAPVAFVSVSTPAQRLETTGSHIGSTTTGRLVTRFSAPNEIGQIFELIENEKFEDALALAEAFLASLDSASHTDATGAVQERYLALNAYCVALTNLGRYNEAVAGCTEAAELMPKRWAAINNRGTAYLALGSYDRALADYRRSLELAPDGNAIGLIEENIGIAETRRAESH